MTFGHAHRLVKTADLIGLRKALDAGLDPNLTNRFGWSLLMLVAIEGKRSMGQELLARGALIQSVNKFGETALSLAAHSGHEAFVTWLLELGAATNCRPHGWMLADWIAQTSGMPPEKIGRVLTLLESHKS
jgi:ankyrin repeat protein